MERLNETRNITSYREFAVMTAQSCTPGHLALIMRTLKWYKKIPEKCSNLIVFVMKSLPRHHIHYNKLFVLSSGVQANHAACTRNMLQQEKTV